MPVPTYDKFIEPILRYLVSRPDGSAAKDVQDAAAAVLHVSDLERQELLPSGVQPVYKNRAGWAHDRLKRAGLSSSPRRGYWRSCFIEKPQSAEQKESLLSVLSATCQRAPEIAESLSPKAARPSQVERCAQSLR